MPAAVEKVLREATLHLTILQPKVLKLGFRVSVLETLGFTAWGLGMRVLRKETLHLQILQPEVSDLGFRVSGPEGFGSQD